MFHLTHPSSLFSHTGCLLAAGFLMVFAGASPLFHGGIWIQTEPVVEALYALGALTSLWLLAGIYRQRLLVTAPRALFIAVAAWIFWQVFTIAFSSSPLRAWFASPQVTDTTSLWVVWALAVMLMGALWPVRRYRLIIISLAIVAAVTLAGLQSLFHEGLWHPWRPNKWPDYLAFVAGYLWLALQASPEVKNDKLYFALLLLCLGILLTSDNMSGILILTPAIACSVFLRARKNTGRFFYPGRNWRLIACLGCLLPVSWYLFSLSYNYHAGIVKFGQEDSFLNARDEGMGSRLLINKVAVSALLHEPGRLAIGNGYGFFNDDLFKYALVDGTSVYEDGIRRPNWFILDGSTHHSHSQPLEALLSFGIGGFLLWLALPITALLALPRRYFWPCAPMVVALSALAYFWFAIPSTLAFHALAWAALASLCGRGKTISMRAQRLLATALAATFFALVFSVCWQASAIHYGTRLIDTVEESSCKSIDTPWMLEDARRDGLRLNEVAINFTLGLIYKSRRGAATEDDIDCLTKLVETARAWSKLPTISDQAAMLDLQLHYELLINLRGDLFLPLKKRAMETLEDAALTITRRAPLRDDRTTIFLTNLDHITHNDRARQFDILDRMLAIAPGHRGARWLMGKLLLSDPATREAGADMLRSAVALGVDRVYPVTEKEMEMWR